MCEKIKAEELTTEELNNFMKKLDAEIENLAKEVDEDMNFYEEMVSDEDLEKIYNEEDITRISGKAIFEKLPDSANKEFTFIIRGRKKHIATIDRSRFTCHEALCAGEKYDFSCVEQDGVLRVESFCVANNKKSTNTPESMNTDKLLTEVGLKLFKYECETKNKGIKIFLELTGKLSDITRKEDIVEFNIQCASNTYRCQMDTTMSVEYSVAKFIKSITDSENAILIDDTLHIGTIDADVEYVLEGILVNDLFYVQNCWINEKNELVEEHYSKEVRKDIIKKISNLPENMRKEIVDFIKKGTPHPLVDKLEASAFTSSSDLRKKYEICQQFYPVSVQKAIEKTLGDKSLKESQKTSILNLLINTRWGENHELNTDINHIKNGMDETHYGLEYLKKELIKLVVSNSRKADNKGANILLVGAPGVGKTSLVKRFASLYNIPFGKISLNGIDTPYYLKGTPRLYDNAIIGHVMRTIHDVGDNSLILLDEIDKVSLEGKEGNPYSALYDLLDKEELFQDDMIEVGLDLSNTIFVLTANDIANVPPAILDRVEVIYVDDYSEEDKKIITSNYVIPKIMSQYGLKERNVVWEEDAISALSDRFTLSNGVRDIERNVLRVVKTLITKKSNGTPKKFIINKSNVTDYLDVKDCDRTKVEREIAGLKRKFQYYKTEYATETQKKICNLFADYDVSERDSKEIIRKRLFSLINILPSGKEIEYDINKARNMLNETHYGMDEVKEQILMYITARKTAKHNTTKCLLLNGMSGIGKTTICKTLAKSLGMPFVKISLNGISTPENINGFEATWHNSEPGVIVKNLSEIGTSSAFILLDEIDKMSKSNEKDPYSALLDLFDNAGGFRDSFCGVPIDLSDAFIVATSNYSENIPMAVMDRMEVIELGGYTPSEKLEITSKCIIPKKLSQYSLEKKLVFSPDAISVIVKQYCKSYGMRDVEKAVEKIICKMLLEANCDIKLSTVNKDTVYRILGARPLCRGNVSSEERAGMARALAVSGNRGTTFAIEVVENPFGDCDEITGLPRQSLTDSIKIAKLLVSKCLERELPKLHIHFAEGGIEKDGPSAGITLFSAIYSYFSGIPIGRDIGFTGEINLYGDVWAIGGTELKIAAAVSEGCKKVFIPYDNFLQLEENDKLKQFECEIIPIKHIEDIINTLFSKKRASM